MKFHDHDREIVKQLKRVKHVQLEVAIQNFSFDELFQLSYPYMQLCCVFQPQLQYHYYLVRTLSTLGTRKLLLPAKQSLGQGNVFTPVCQSFCSQGRSASGSGEGVCLWVQDGSLPLGLHTPQTHTRPFPEHERYASYWNAFLLETFCCYLLDRL